MYSPSLLLLLIIHICTDTFPKIRKGSERSGQKISYHRTEFNPDMYLRGVTCIDPTKVHETTYLMSLSLRHGSGPDRKFFRRSKKGTGTFELGHPFFRPDKTVSLSVDLLVSVVRILTSLVAHVGGRVGPESIVGEEVGIPTLTPSPGFVRNG